MKYFKFTEEQDNSSLAEMGVPVSEAARDWQEDPNNIDKFEVFMHALGAANGHEDLYKIEDGTYILKPESMQKLMKIIEDFKKVAQFDSEYDNYKIHQNIKFKSISVEFEFAGFDMCENDKVLWNEITELWGEMDISLSNRNSILITFTVKDAFVHVKEG